MAISTAKIRNVVKATINNCKPTSLVKFVAIIPEPTIAIAKIAVPKNSAKITRIFIYETPIISTTNIKVSFLPIGPEPSLP